MQKLLRSAFLLVLLASCGRSTDSSNQIKILSFQDSRSPADSLYPFLRNEMTNTRAVAALGQMQDTAAIDTLVNLINTPSQSLSKEVLFALGQIGYGSGSMTAQTRIEIALLNNYASLKSTNQKIKLIEALGKNGSLASAGFFQALLKDSSNNILGEAAMAVARMAIRKIKNASMDSCVIPLLKNRNADVRWKAIYAIMRTADGRWADSLLPMVKDADYRVRMDAARALGAMKIEETFQIQKAISGGHFVIDTREHIRNRTVDALLESASNDTDWHVRVNAVTALGNFKFKIDDLKKVYFLIILEGKRDKNLHVRISAIRSMAKSYIWTGDDEGDVINAFEGKFFKNAEWQEKGEILVALAQMFREQLNSHFFFTESMGDSNGYLRARNIEAMGEIKSSKFMEFLENALKDPFALVQNNAIEALGKINTEASREVIIRSLATHDLTLLAIAAGSLSGDEKIKGDKKKSEMISQKIIESYKQIKPPTDVEAQMNIFDALGDLKSASSADFLKPFLGDSDIVVAKGAARNLEKITGGKITVSVEKKINSIDWVYLTKLKTKKPSAVIETNKGVIEIDFYAEEAPLTVMNFVALAEKKFFDGRYFHRVVPNFVIQGGDPLGTGWGGPGYSIRSEFSDLKYERGTMGMASAGRDTEGCQWFIAHSPVPHLDGRYTIFAKVRKGMEAVDEIQVGDQIRSVKIIWH